MLQSSEESVSSFLNSQQLTSCSSCSGWVSPCCHVSTLFRASHSLHYNIISEPHTEFALITPQEDRTTFSLIQSKSYLSKNPTIQQQGGLQERAGNRLSCSKAEGWASCWPLSQLLPHSLQGTGCSIMVGFIPRIKQLRTRNTGHFIATFLLSRSI